MGGGIRITDPSLLEESSIIIHLSNLSIGPSKPPSETPQTKLVLLQPLANPETLSACRDPNSRIIRKSNGAICGTANYEYLDIKPLSKAWRQALVKLPPIPYLVFDLSLPKEEEESNGSGQFQKVYWDTVMPSNKFSLGIHGRDVMTLVITIATEMTMRAEGEVHFEVTFGEDVPSRGMPALEKQLLALSKFKAPAINDGVEGKDGE